MPCTALQPTSKPGQPRVVCISVITRWCSSCIFQEAPLLTVVIIRAICCGHEQYGHARAPNRVPFQHHACRIVSYP